jgi:hypothetical protein
MKKMLMGLVAAATLTSFVAPIFAEEAPAAEKPAKAKKSKKAKKAEEPKKDEAAPAK